MSGSKRISVISLIIIIVLVISLIVINLTKNSNQQSNQNGTDNTTGQITSKDITTTKQGDAEISGVNITSDGNNTSVEANVKNNSSKTYSTIEVSIVFYDNNKTVLATSNGLIENLGAGESKGFISSISGDYSKSSTYEVKISKAE